MMPARPRPGRHLGWSAEDLRRHAYGKYFRAEMSPLRAEVLDTLAHGPLPPELLPRLEDVAVHLDPDFIARSASELVQTDRVEIVTACEGSDPLIHQISLALAAEVDAGAPAGSIYAESLVSTLVAHLLRHYSNASDRFQFQFGGLPKHKLRRVIEFMDENLERDLTLAELAEVADLSPFHFARSFKQTTGSTPIQFLMQRRIDFARRLLVESELPIVEIGLRAGFKNQSHFATLFRKITAMTPKAYRNEHLR